MHRFEWGGGGGGGGGRYQGTLLFTAHRIGFVSGFTQELIFCSFG
jgi:hypothetical protein